MHARPAADPYRAILCVLLVVFAGRFPPGALFGAYHGTQIIVGGTGDLAKLHGLLRQMGGVTDVNGVPAGTYTGRLLTTP